MKKAIGTAGQIIGAVILIGIIVAILSLFNWNPIEAVVTIINRISDFFLQFDWFRTLFGR